MTHWYKEKKKEHYYREAKRVGYRARSAFKLKQIQKRFNIIKKDDTVIDLGAAPGGWSQVAIELVGKQGSVIAVDISPIKPITGVRFIQGDITDTGTIDRLKQTLEDKKADVVISDMSPDISGNYSMDQARSMWLCEKALEVSKFFLKNNGSFVCKLFQGEDSQVFIEKIKQSFYNVKQLSPPASRIKLRDIYNWKTI